MKRLIGTMPVFLRNVCDNSQEKAADLLNLDVAIVKKHEKDGQVYKEDGKFVLYELAPVVKK